MVEPRVLLVHGAATTGAVWERVVPLLDGLDVLAPDRACSGDLATELDALTPAAEGAVVVGVSGGATLGLALAATAHRLAGAVLHEPAVGSLVPGLLDHVVAGYAAAGVPGFGAALYGPSWSPAMAPADPGAVARDLAMFRRFEPSPVAAGQGPVLVTVGGASPPPRHAAARVLGERFGVQVRVLPGCAHFVQQDAPDVLAAVIRSVVDAAVTRQSARGQTSRG
ncbi:MAG TPA: alpha/beta hydrolase [Actinotalea sp.]|nr:alpha/beta hydrolase [Actinotalea sp.]